jgi:uncharacterized protein involved in exopolysaccharide biosynthesis
MTMSTASKRSARLFLTVVIGLGSIATFSLIAVLASAGRIVVESPELRATNESGGRDAVRETESSGIPQARTLGSPTVRLDINEETIPR